MGSKIHPLHDEQQTMLREMLRRLNPVMDTDACLLGGGTALECRWQHRRSTDIDLFIDLRSWCDYSEEIMKMATYWGRDSGVDIHLEPNGFVCRNSPHGQGSLHTSGDITRIGRSGEFLPDGSIELQKSAEILVRKIQQRIVVGCQYLIRDAYDVVCGAWKEPRALQEAVNCLTPADRMVLHFDSKNPPKMDARAPLIEPTYPSMENVRELQSLLFEAFHETFSHLSRGRLGVMPPRRLWDR